jgi:hypothetical protein
VLVVAGAGGRDGKGWLLRLEQVIELLVDKRLQPPLSLLPRLLGLAARCVSSHHHLALFVLNLGLDLDLLGERAQARGYV